MVAFHPDVAAEEPPTSGIDGMGHQPGAKQPILRLFKRQLHFVFFVRVLICYEMKTGWIVAGDSLIMFSQCIQICCVEVQCL